MERIYKKVDGLKCLVVCIDHHITWKDHITYTQNKLCISMVYMYIRQAMHLMQTPDSVFVMQSFNHILVIILKYGETNIKIISTHYLFYKKVIRIVCHARSLDHTSQMFHRLDILKTHDLIDYNTCILINNSLISPFHITKEVFNVMK